MRSLPDSENPDSPPDTVGPKFQNARISKTRKKSPASSRRAPSGRKSLGILGNHLSNHTPDVKHTRTSYCPSDPLSRRIQIARHSKIFFRSAPPPRTRKSLIQPRYSVCFRFSAARNELRFLCLSISLSHQ